MKRTYARHLARIAPLLVAGLMTVPPAHGAATQLDAADEPTVNGNLELESDGCRRQREKYRGDVVAKGKTCLRIYTYDPGSETDDARDYGVVWLQSNLNSSRRWCGSEVLSDVDLPDNIRLESRAPRVIELNRRKTYKTELTVDAGGNSSSSTETSVEQDQMLYPEKVRTRVQKSENVFRLKWKGLENAKLGFASGAEISWAEDDSPGGISFLLNYQLKRGRC